MVSCFSIISLFYHEYITIITFVSWYDDIYINNYILGLSENHHTILYTSYITILLYNYFIIMISLWNSSATESSTIGGHFYDSTALTTDPWLTITHLGERCFTESIKVPNELLRIPSLIGFYMGLYYIPIRWPIVGKPTDQPVSWDGIGEHLMAQLLTRGLYQLVYWCLGWATWGTY